MADVTGGDGSPEEAEGTDCNTMKFSPLESFCHCPDKNSRPLVEVAAVRDGRSPKSVGQDFATHPAPDLRLSPPGK